MKISNIKIGKLNVFDILVVLVVLIFAMFFIGTKMNHSNDNSVETNANGEQGVNHFTYTISIEGLSETSQEAFRSGDEVYDRISNGAMGTIKEVHAQPATSLLEQLDGSLVKKEVPKKIDVVLTIETDGNIKNGEHLANGLIRILVGSYKEIKTKYITCSGIITGIETADAKEQ